VSNAAASKPHARLVNQRALRCPVSTAGKAVTYLEGQQAGENLFKAEDLRRARGTLVVAPSARLDNSRSIRSTPPSGQDRGVHPKA